PIQRISRVPLHHSTYLMTLPQKYILSLSKTITAESGDTVTLPCRAPNNRHITVVDWRRSGLTDKSVLLYWDNKIVSDEQDPSFKNRVALQDVKDGDVSLILKNVTTHDTGIYECRVDQQTESHRRKRAVDPISSTYLRVIHYKSVKCSSSCLFLVSLIFPAFCCSCPTFLLLSLNG
uniref:Ig-like domain-containing protein n=1 Tax=Oreochromis niloticus TaxID=8128 RepID=A0A669F1E0_ORENI